jgi:hypothetical protein
MSRSSDLYDVVIDMDWLESHEVILNYKMKQLILVDDEGQRLHR